MSYDVITIGSATRDIIIRTDAGKLIDVSNNPAKQKLLGFEYGAKIPVLQTYDNFGGGGCNVAVGMALLGLNVAARINVGKDLEGLKIKRNLKKYHVDTKFISWDDQEKTDLSVVIINEDSDGDHVVFNDKNASQKLSFNFRHVRPKWFYLSSLSGKWEEFLGQVLNYAKSKKISVAFNPGANQLSQGYLKLKDVFNQLDILILSIDEAVDLVLSKNKNFSLISGDIARELYSWGPKLVVITEGEKGASLYDGVSIKHQPGQIVEKIIDTTGAGDAFSAGFIAAIIFGKNLETALVWGVKNGANTVKDYGAQTGLLNRKDIEKII